jgi:hypothetical protein
MVINNPTFGCGDFLPGYGPFNFGGDFGWDGFVDGGSGGDGGDDDGDDGDDGGGDPPNPPECHCYTRSSYGTFGTGDQGGEDKSIWTVTITQDCLEDGQNNAGGGDPEDYSPPEPPPGNITWGAWSGGTVNQGGGTNGSDCTEDDECGECPDIVIVYTRDKLQDPDSGEETENCTCKISGFGDPTTPGVSDDGKHYLYSKKYTQECSNATGQANQDAQDDLDDLLDSLSNPPSNPGLGEQDGPPTVTGGGEDCTDDDGGCTKECNDIVVEWKVVRLVVDDAGTSTGIDLGDPLQAGGGLSEGTGPGGGTVTGDPEWYWTGNCDPGMRCGQVVGTGPGEYSTKEECEIAVAGFCGFAVTGDGNSPILGQPKTSKTSTPTLKNLLRAGSALLKHSKKSKSSQIAETVKSGKVDLNNPALQRKVINRRPAGFLDPDIAMRTLPEVGKMVPNTRNTEILAESIDENIEYILKNNKRSTSWNSTKISAITVSRVIQNLNPKVLKLLRDIRHYDGSRLSDRDIYNIVGTRIIDGTLRKLDLKTLEEYAKTSRRSPQVEIIKGNQPLVNEAAALALIERRYFPLDPSKVESRMKWVLPNWKVFATDVDKHIEIKIANGTVMPFYINDDNTLIGRSNLKVQDGDFIEIRVGGVLKKFFCKSEIDHAFIVPEKAKQQAIHLLGGDGSRTLTVSSTGSSVEFDYSLTAPRQNFYVLSANLGTLETKPTSEGSYLLKDTTLTYELVDTTSVGALDTLNEYIRYKANYRAYVIDDDDRLLDYVEDTEKLQVKQTDILFDAPRTNKNIPLLTRQVPWYIILYPTNRPDYNLFNAKSRLETFDPGEKVVRTLKTKPTTIPRFSKRGMNLFAQQVTGYPTYTNAIGQLDTQTRITKINANQNIFDDAYRVRTKYGSAESMAPSRKKTSLRLVKEIIEELNNNYIIAWDSLGRTLTKFDVFSRLTMRQYNTFKKLENYRLVFSKIRNGLIKDVRIFDPINRADRRISVEKTQLQQRRSGAGSDTFPVIKAMESGFRIVPPTKSGAPSFAPIDPIPTTPPSS